MHHFVHAIRGTGFIIPRKSVDEATVCYSHLHVTGLGFNFTHAHIAADLSLSQIDVALCAGVDLRAIAIRGIDQIRTGDVDGLL